MAEQPTARGFKIEAVANLFSKEKPTPACILLAIAGPNTVAFEMWVKGEFSKNIYVDRDKARQLAEYILKIA